MCTMVIIYLDFVIIDWCIFYIDILWMTQQEELHYIDILQNEVK